ncbi:MAG: hypothetical protein ACUVWV_02150 [Thermodesulfobacteriota bacterium]
MNNFNSAFLEKMKKKLDIELLGAAILDEKIPSEMKNQATALLPETKSIVVLGKEIFWEVVALLSPGKAAGEAEAGELFGPHSDYLNGRLTRAVYDLASFFHKEGYQCLPLPAAGCPTDQRFLKAIFSYKHAAQLAGLGVIGRHGLLITPQFGPRVRLACLLTSAEVEPSRPRGDNFCLDCAACIRACPAQALQMSKAEEQYAMNKFACRTYRQAGLTCSICLKTCAEVLEKNRKQMKADF